MKNVLLLCLSTVSPRAQKSNYIYNIDGEEILLEGYMTNEAPTKAVISKLKKYNGSQRLDKVVMICSTTVLEDKLFLVPGENAIENLELKKAPGDYTHKEFYLEMIEKCQDTPIEFVEVGIPDFTNDQELTKSVLEAAKEVTKDDDDVQLFIDFNGGPRPVAFMILAIANLMELRKIKIQEIMTMNFDNKVNGMIPIQNMMPVFESFDLIGGINEYVRYGRINGLKQYFAPSGSEKIHAILNEMEEFANNLQLCRTDYIMNKKGDLLNSLNSYILAEEEKSEEEKQKRDTYELLFLYVIHDIIKGCKELLEGELPAVIDWCVDKGFVQQALTFCSEEMPAYFWKKNIFCASRAEEKGYQFFLDYTPKNEENKIRKLCNKYTEGKTSFSRYAYNWMITFLPYSFKEKEFKEVIEKMEVEENLQLLEMKPPYTRKKIEQSFETLRDFDFSNVKIKKDSQRKATELASLLVWFFLQQKGRVISKNVGKIKLGEILTVYFLLKEQRNKTNHANADDGAWTYSELCSVMKQMVSVLNTIK